MGRLSDYKNPEDSRTVDDIVWDSGNISAVFYSDGTKEEYTYTDMLLTEVRYYKNVGGTYTLMRTETINYTDGFFTGVTVS